MEVCISVFFVIGLGFVFWLGLWDFMVLAVIGLWKGVRGGLKSIIGLLGNSHYYFSVAFAAF